MNDIITYPDDSGWFWFKESEDSDPICVFVSDEGVASFLNSEGKSGELDDLVGIWEQAEITI